MPLYEYECSQCHRRTEKIQKFSDPELTVCPHCGGPLARTITAAAISFKGGGWYKDGYASAKPTGTGSESSTSASTTSDSSSAAPATPAASSPAPAPAAVPAAAPAAASTASKV